MRSCAVSWRRAERRRKRPAAAFRATAKRLPEADTKEGAAYRLTAVSWQEAGDGGPTAEPSQKRAYAAAVYRYGEGRLAFVHWEK